MTTMDQPKALYCEAKGHTFPWVATHIYGPECEAETGKLMYLCSFHASQISAWIQANLNMPINCPTHGRLGKVKNSVILKKIPKAGL